MTKTAVVIGALTLVIVTAPAFASDLDRSYDPVKSMAYAFQGVSIEEGKQIERALRDAGYDPGLVDGVLGPEALRAIERFQERHGLAPTARPDGATLAALGLDSASASP